MTCEKRTFEELDDAFTSEPPTDLFTKAELDALPAIDLTDFTFAATPIHYIIKLKEPLSRYTARFGNEPAHCYFLIAGRCKAMPDNFAAFMVSPYTYTPNHELETFPTSFRVRTTLLGHQRMRHLERTLPLPMLAATIFDHKHLIVPTVEYMEDYRRQMNAAAVVATADPPASTTAAAAAAATSVAAIISLPNPTPGDDEREPIRDHITSIITDEGAKPDGRKKRRVTNKRATE